MERRSWIRAALALAVVAGLAYALKTHWQQPLDDLRDALRDADGSMRETPAVDPEDYRFDAATQRWAPARWYYRPYPEGYVERYHYEMIRESPPPRETETRTRTQRETLRVESAGPSPAIEAPAPTIAPELPEKEAVRRAVADYGARHRHRLGDMP